MKCGLLGRKLGHSYSPVIHGYLGDYSYELFEREEEELADFFADESTFDAINGKGEYLGGAIYPGLKISMEALFSRTAKLPRVEIADPGSVIGKNTVSSMQSGVLFGYVGAVENIVRLMKQDLGEDTKVVATGGLASLISSHASCIEKVDRPIMLDGLLMIYKDYKAANK